MKLLTEEAEFMEKILPEHYTITAREKYVQCTSPTGIRKNIFGYDEEDDEHWDFILNAIRQKYGARFQEVYHNTCTYHVNFSVYIKPA